MGAAPADAIDGALFLGELSLEGTVQPVRGVLPKLLGARARGVKRAVVPRANADEAALVDGIDVRTVGSLGELVEALRGRGELLPREAVSGRPRRTHRSTTSPTCEGRRPPGARSRSRRPAVTTCS